MRSGEQVSKQHWAHQQGTLRNPLSGACSLASTAACAPAKCRQGNGRGDLDVVQLRFRLHLPLAILCNGHFFHGRDAVARELLVDDIGLGELQWMRHDHGPPRCRKHRRKCSGEIPLSAAGRYVRFARDAWRPAKTGSPTALPRVRGSLVSDRWLKNGLVSREEN